MSPISVGSMSFACLVFYILYNKIVQRKNQKRDKNNIGRGKIDRKTKLMGNCVENCIRIYFKCVAI